jgi:hypothetical protein
MKYRYTAFRFDTPGTAASFAAVLRLFLPEDLPSPYRAVSYETGTDVVRVIRKIEPDDPFFGSIYAHLASHGGDCNLITDFEVGEKK